MKIRFLQKHTLLLLFVTLLCTGTAGAQRDDDDDFMGMMPGMGMHQGMGMMGMMGMMGCDGDGMGGGWMGGGIRGIHALDLTEQQQQKVTGIQDQLRKEQWQIMGKALDSQIKIRDAWSADKPDPQKVAAAYDEYSKLQREALVAKVKAQNSMYDILTNEQKEQLKSFRNRGWGMMRGQNRGGMMMQ